MKKISILLIFLILSSCSRDDNNSSSDNSIKKLVKSIHVVENSNIPGNPVTDRTITFSYSGDQIINISTLRKGAATPYNIIIGYNNGLVDKVSFSSSNSNLKFNYTNGKLMSANYYKIPGYNTDALFNFTYDADRLQKIAYTGTNANFTNELTYNNENVSNIKIIKNGSYQNYTHSYPVSYDAKYNAFSHLSRDQQILFALLGDDEVGDFAVFNGFSWSSFWGKHNVTSYKNYTFAYEYDKDDYVKKLSLSYPNQNNATTQTTFEYTYQ